MSLSGAVALITGAASGIGRACALRYAAEGATVVATDVGSDDGVLADHGIALRPLDVADPAVWADMVEAIGADHGRLDLVHLNAGIRLGVGDVTELSDDDYLRLIGVNQHGVLFGLRATVPLLEQGDGGAVIVTGSRASIGPLPLDLAYAMAKHAVAALVRSAADDLAARQISINAICPATVATGFLGDVGRDQLEAAGIEVMDAEEVADGVMQIIASGETGQCFVQLRGEAPTPFPFPAIPGR